jgi:uncharacterized protein (TIGR04255 family)
MVRPRIADACSKVCSVSATRARKHPKLARAPLASVICQARFSHVLALGTEEGQRDLLAQLQQRLPQYPLFTRAAQQSFVLSPEQIQPLERKVSSFQFSSEDEHWVVGVAMDSVSLQTKRYEDFRDFQDRWRSIAEAVRETLKPALQTRFGLRYVDQLTFKDANTPAAWSRLLKPTLYGLGTSEKWRERVRQSYQEWVLDLERGVCTLRHGFLPGLFENQQPFYFLDVDCFIEETQPFEPSSQGEVLDSFNDAAHSLFRWSLKPELYQSYGPEPD